MQKIGSGGPNYARIAQSLLAPRPNISVSELLTQKPGKYVISGWVHGKPKKLSKSLTFLKLRDSYGKIMQIVDRNTPALCKNMKPDTTLTLEVAKPSLDGDVECTNLTVLNPANLVPGELMNLGDMPYPPKYRYIELRSPQFQHTLRMRSQIIRHCRETLNKQDFVEIETPLLFKSTPEGAKEFLVPSRRKGYSYALPQSPQQYKQLLIASGVNRYYQVAKCFRDEDLRADRQPEFTQLDIEIAFTTPEITKNIVENIVTSVFDAYSPKKLEILPRISYDECMALYGCDKPDLRFEYSIAKLGTSIINPDFPVLECILLPSNTDVAAIQSTNPRIRILEYVSNETEFVSRLTAFTSDPEAAAKTISALKGIKEGSLLALSDRQEVVFENPTPLGQVRLQLCAENVETINPDICRGFWVERFPSFEPEVEHIDEKGYPHCNTSKLTAMHHPFTMPYPEDFQYIQSREYLKVKGMHYDFVLDGVELGGGSQRIHDAELQRSILDDILKVNKVDETFGHLLNALATGCPPHGGFAIGLDRMIANILKKKSIRDVIAFPKTITGADPVVGSPSKVATTETAAK